MLLGNGPGIGCSLITRTNGCPLHVACQAERKGRKAERNAILASVGRWFVSLFIRFHPSPIGARALETITPTSCFALPTSSVLH